MKGAIYRVDIDGKVVYPATITDAVVRPTDKKTVTTILTELETEVSEKLTPEKGNELYQKKGDYVASAAVGEIRVLTQEEYDAITTPDENTLYCILE